MKRGLLQELEIGVSERNTGHVDVLQLVVVADVVANDAHVTIVQVLVSSKVEDTGQGLGDDCECDISKSVIIL